LRLKKYDDQIEILLKKEDQRSILTFNLCSLRDFDKVMYYNFNLYINKIFIRILKIEVKKLKYILI